MVQVQKTLVKSNQSMWCITHIDDLKILFLGNQIFQENSGNSKVCVVYNFIYLVLILEIIVVLQFYKSLIKFLILLSVQSFFLLTFLSVWSNKVLKGVAITKSSGKIGLLRLFNNDKKLLIFLTKFL